MPLPEGPGISISVDCFGPHLVTPRGNNYILLATDRFSRRADMFAVTTAEYTAQSTANILVNKSSLGMPTHYPLEQRPPVLRPYFSISFWGPCTYHKLLEFKRQRKR